MSARRLVLRFFLDEGVPDSVGETLRAAGHSVILLRESVAPGSPDPLVCAASEANDAILVALDGDMRALAQRAGVGRRRFRRLSLIKLSCPAPKASDRIKAALSLIEHEWNYNSGTSDRRIFVEVGADVIRTWR